MNPVSNTRPARAFTLVELIVVIMVISILLVLVVPTLYPGGGPKLQNSASLLVGELVKAQQLALRDRAPVEVRVYSFDPPDGKALVDEVFRGYQVFTRKEDGEFIAESEVILLENPIVISNDPAYTSLATSELQPAGEDFPLETDANYFSFRFTGDGSTNLGKGEEDNWFMTLYSAKDFIRDGDLPPDFITIQIDPVSGKVRIFRPE